MKYIITESQFLNLLNEQEYVVKPGDTLGKISKKYGVDVNTLSKENNIKDINRIEVGQTIKIPQKNKSSNLDFGIKQYDTVRDTTSPYGQEARQKAEALKYLKNVNTGITSNLPLHIRAFLQYLLGRTNVWTERDMTEKEQQSLRVFLQANKGKPFTYEYWDAAGASGTPTAMSVKNVEKEMKRLGKGNVTDLFSPGTAAEFKYFFGRVPIEHITFFPNENKFRVIDNYDMNAFNKQPEEIIKQAANAVKMYVQGKGTAYGMIRNLASLKELQGFKGFPVNVTV